jgi:hypothetical protein
MKIELRKTSDVKPYDKNPRQNDGAVDAVAKPLREFGWRQPIVVDSGGMIVVGHTCWKAAIAAGLSSFKGTTHHQGLDLARHPSKSKPTQKKLRARDRPLANDFVSDEEFDRLLHAWFGNMARVLAPGRGFYIWGGYANCGNYPPVLKACKLYFSQAIIWHKMHPVLTRKDRSATRVERVGFAWERGNVRQP